MKLATLARGIAGGPALCLAGAAGAGELVTDSIASKAAGRDVRFTAYLPDGYKDAPVRFPVVYLLHGAGGDEYEWARKGSAVETLDGLMRPMVAIMPTTGPASWWADGAAEKAETAMMTELLPSVEAKYKVSTGRGDRQIAGLSMGGYGALNLALRYPAKFCAAGIISPAICDPLPPDTSAARRTPQFVRNGQFDPDTWKALNYPAHLDKYAQAPQKVPMWIVSGDHEWMAFRDALPDALQYIDRQCTKAPSPVSDRAGAAPTTRRRRARPASARRSTARAPAAWSR